MLTDCLKNLMRGESLTAEAMATAVGEIMDGQGTAAQVAAFLVALRCKGETADEIFGAASAMRQRMTRIRADGRPLLDTCGTGGDGSGTFNISTAVAFVAAAGGAVVAKHGNRAVSSKSGSADVLAELGVNVGAPVAVVEHCLRDIGIGFLFAPTMHPAMKHAAPIRRELGVRTVFNVLGPLTNPAGATHQLMGVFDRKLLRPLAEVLGRLGSERAWVVHSADGLDEISVCDVTYVAELNKGQVNEFVIEPIDLGIDRAPPESLQGGDAAGNAATMRALLSGDLHGPLREAVALNAAAALVVIGTAGNLVDGVNLANGIIDSGEALRRLERLAAASQDPT